MPLAFSAVRAVARLAIAGFAKEGLTANAIVRQLGNLSLTYRRVMMLKDIREFTGLLKLESTVRRVAWDVMFPQYAMFEGYHPKARKYRVFGIATQTDPKTGEETERAISFYTNTRSSKNDWYDAFMAEYPGIPGSPSEFITDLEITSVEHQRGWKY